MVIPDMDYSVPLPMMASGLMLENQVESTPQEVVIETVRQYFPESWLWSLDTTKLFFFLEFKNLNIF